MARAGIFIGVDRTGGLQKLNDAAAGARRMYEWGVAQGLDTGRSRLITDAGGAKVRPDDIQDAVEAAIAGAGVEQLIVYFAGHGVNINRSEQWLLSDAPERTSAAVNVAGSVELARYSGVPYVVFISDACRVAAEGIQAQNVRGVDIFPNEEGSERAQPVDQFFACVLGRTAAEIKDPAAAADSFEAIYTEVLLEALRGKNGDVLESAADGKRRYVKPAKLRDHLAKTVPQRIAARGLAARVNQSPDAIVTAHENWLASFAIEGVRHAGGEAPGDGDGFPGTGGQLGVAPPPAAAQPREVTKALDRLMQVAMHRPASALNIEFENFLAQALPGAGEILSTTERVAAPFGPDHHETQCGIKLRGARATRHLFRRGQVEPADREGRDFRVSTGEAGSVLLEIDGEGGALVPVVPGFLTALTFEDGELVDLALEPSANHPRYLDFERRAAELRNLRGVAAAASQQGRFRLEGHSALDMAQRMQYAKSVDPTLAVYAAYAYNDLQQLERLREMSAFLLGDLGVRLFDVALLARELRGVAIGPETPVVPCAPLLAQGWALLGASGVRLPPAVEAARLHVRESLWTLYDAEGFELLASAIRNGEIR